jgi:hypothetical protein
VLLIDFFVFSNEKIISPRQRGKGSHVGCHVDTFLHKSLPKSFLKFSKISVKKWPRGMTRQQGGNDDVIKFKKIKKQITITTNNNYNDIFF